MSGGENRFTLITGASQGIGKALARECARRKMNLLLVALPGDDLDLLVATLKEEYRVDVRMLGLDLLALDAPSDVYRWCGENNFSVNMLINNIGVGGRGSFESAGTGELDQMLLLNIRAATLLSRLFVEKLRQHPRSFILNVGSAAGFFHIPYKAVYSATKAYLYSLSRALRSELRPLGIHVALVTPGGANNRVDPVVHKKVGGWLHRNLHHSTDQIACAAIDGLLKGKKVIIPGMLPKVYIKLSTVFPPSWVDAVVNRLFRKDT